MMKRMRITDGGLRNIKSGEKSSEFGVRSSKLRYLMILVLIFFSVMLGAFRFQPSVFASDKWPGVDESVVEKYAKEQGREAKEPLIPTDQGDLLLFVFLLAGAVGGFIAGYYWRMLMAEKTSKITREKEVIRS